MKAPGKGVLVSRRRVLASLAGGIGVIATAKSGGIAAAQGVTTSGGQAEPGSAVISASEVTVDLGTRLGAMKIDRFSVGQGGFSSRPTFAERTAEVRALRPRAIRLFLQEYYNLLPAPGVYNFTTLDKSIDSILEAGAKPLLCMVFKPKVLFPRIDQDLVAPTSWPAWDALVYNLVHHYKERNSGGWYWEIGNEWDAESGGGTPYHMTPQQYTTFYRHTVAAIRRADPEARVGGPAQADFNAPLIPALLSFCGKNAFPLDFVSWHGYRNDPQWFRKTIDSMHEMLRQHPNLHPETVIDEWNMALGEEHVDPRFQPAFVAETTFQMIEAGLDLSCYYQIRDYPFAANEFTAFYPASMISGQERFWDRRPVCLGLFDYQNRVRPAYFVFLLLERLTGDRLGVRSGSANVRALATKDDQLKITSVLLWNYSEKPAVVNLQLAGLPEDVNAWRFLLDVSGNNYDQNLRPLPAQRLPKGDQRLQFTLAPWGVTLVSLEER